MRMTQGPTAVYDTQYKRAKEDAVSAFYDALRNRWVPTMNGMKPICLIMTAAGAVLMACSAGLGWYALALGTTLTVLGVGGFFSLLIMEGGVGSGQDREYGSSPSILSRWFRRERERQFCPHCGAPIRFLSGLGPYAGLSGGWYCGKCKKEVAPPTRSPEYRREQRESRRF